MTDRCIDSCGKSLATRTPPRTHRALRVLVPLLICCGCDWTAREKKPGAPAAQTSTIRVAAASDLKFALAEVIAAFEKQQPPIRIVVTYGSSGNLYAQLLHKAPFDLYLSADVAYPQKLIDAGLADGKSAFVYGIGEIVVWVPDSSRLEVEQLGLKLLTDPRVRKIAIANPAHAPYGRAAEAALKSLGVYEQVKGRLVLGDNVAQATHFVVSGAADVGIIGLALALSPTIREQGHYWMIPKDAHPRLNQGGVILSWAANRTAAEGFREFLTSASGREILARFGFEPPEDK